MMTRARVMLTADPQTDGYTNAGARSSANDRRGRPSGCDTLHQHKPDRMEAQARVINTAAPRDDGYTNTGAGPRANENVADPKDATRIINASPTF